MVEYGNGVGQAGQVAHGGSSASGGSTDLGAAIAGSLTDALNHASSALGVPPALLAIVAVVVVLFVGWLIFAR